MVGHVQRDLHRHHVGHVYLGTGSVVVMIHNDESFESLIFYSEFDAMCEVLNELN